MTATDPSSVSDSITVTIDVDDVNEAPAFATETATRSVPENSSAGTDVGAPVTASDPDSDNLVYSLSGPTAFTIVRGTGQIRVAANAALDHETTDSYDVTVTATDPSSVSDSITVTIDVDDVNETPAFGSRTVALRVDEGAGAGTSVGAPVTATDPDGDTLVYSLSGGDAASFSISSAGQLTVATGVTIGARGTIYSVTVTARDPSGATGSTAVTITATRVNQAPAFATETASRSVAENSGEGADVGLPVTATDIDNDTLEYGLSGSTAFTIVSGTGQIQVAAGVDLDHESTDSYDVTVTATDPSGASDSISVTIGVDDVNEAPAFASATTSRDINENSPPATTLGESGITATDPEGDTLVYSLSGSDAFEVVAETGVIRVAAGAALDFETTPSYELALTATDPLGLSGSITVTASLNDVNDAPAFVPNAVDREVAENSPADTNVGAPVTAVDQDLDTLVYSLSGSTAFTIARDTGQIRVAAGADLDHEGTSSYSVTVTATDPSGATGAATVTISVTDANEAPAFVRNAVDREVPENSGAGTDVGAPVTATDPDNDALEYSLGGAGAVNFSIVRDTGQVRVGVGVHLNFERRDSYSVTLTARDPSGATASIRVNVAVGDVNEAPVFMPDSVDRDIDENSAAGTGLGAALTATDEDGDGLAYSLSGSPAFELAQNGQVRVAPDAVLDHEATPRHTLTLTARDPEGLSGSARINVEVNDVNDAPRFRSGSFRFSLHDNTGGGTNFGRPVTATDQDGDALDYSLGGADAVTFRISPDGQLSVARGTTIGAAGSSYSFTITARDPSGATATALVTVAVTAYVPEDLDGPPVRSARSMLCMGFPGCPDSYLFLFPTLAVAGASTASWKFRNRRKLPSVYALIGLWGGSVLVTAVLVKADPLLAGVFIIVPVFVGVIWLALGGARR